MERLCNLFFELSNEDRLSILLKLMEEPKKLTHIANELGLTVQECSRQLSRLSDIDLVTKDPEGLYILQPYGRHTFRLFPGFQFLTEHVEYFNRHTLSRIPEKFMGRIGELRKVEPVTELMATMAKVERLISEAEEYFWYISQETLATVHGLKIAIEVMDKGVKGRGIEPLTYRRPRDIELNLNDEMREAMRNHRMSGVLDNKYLEEIDLTFYLNEREVAIIAFPAETGEYDYLGFSSTDPKVHEWCRDVFEYYWERGVSWQEHLGRNRG